LKTEFCAADPPVLCLQGAKCSWGTFLIRGD
jgi:hypothetical protein